MALAAVSLVLIALVLGGAARGGRPGGTPDRKPPSPPTKIRAISATPSALSLVWNGSRDNVGVAGYYVQADRRRARVFVPAYTVKGLSCNETVSVRIVAYDRAGNRSKIARATVSTATCIALTVSKAGNDATCRRGQLSRPCATFNRAYALAKCRDVVEVKAGSYGDQDIADTSRDCPNHARVVIRRESGAPVIVRKIQLGTTREDWGFSTDGPDDLTLSGFKLTWGFMVYSDAKNIVADRMDGGSFLVAGDHSDPAKAPDGITIRDSDWGPCTPAGSFHGQFSDCTTVFEQHAPGRNGEGQNQIAQGARNVLVERNTIHDFVIDRAGAHWECFWINGGHNVTFRANKLWNCETTVWSVGEHSGQSLTGTWYFENNWVGRAINSGTPLNFTQYPYNGKVIVRFNSFGPLQSSGGERGAVGRQRHDQATSATSSVARGCASQAPPMPTTSSSMTTAAERQALRRYREQAHEELPIRQPRSLRGRWTTTSLGGRSPTATFRRPCPTPTSPPTMTGSRAGPPDRRLRRTPGAIGLPLDSWAASLWADRLSGMGELESASGLANTLT